MAHEELIHQIFERIINQGDLDATDELMDEAFVDHGPMGDMQGREAFKQMVGMWRSAVPDVRCDVEGLFTSGDMAAWLVRVTGTHTGEMMGIPPTGRRIELLSPNIGRVRDGRAVEHWADQSMFQFLMQIGALPLPAASASS